MSFQAPIGTSDERASGSIWPGRWVDATGYDIHYELGYHTGADLNLNFPHFDADAHSDVYAMGDGTVTFARRYPNLKAWGNIIVIDHGEVEGKPLFSRYAHVEGIMVAENATVQMGQTIAHVGNGEGLFPYHLHFDISRTDALRKEAGHWPGENQSSVLFHYVNPQEWLQLHVTDGVPNLNIQLTRAYYVTATNGLRLRKDHKRSAQQVGSLLFGSKVFIVDSETVTEDSFIWGRISGSQFNDDWLAIGPEDQSETYISRFPPNM